MVGPPKVINKKVNDKLLEPYEVSAHCYGLHNRWIGYMLIPLI